MFLKTIYKKVILSIFVSVIITGGFYPQNMKDNNVEIARSQYIFARNMSENLTEKLKLNNSQKKALVSILLDYQDNLLNLHSSSRENFELVGGKTKSVSKYISKLLNDTNQQIIDILNSGQQVIYYRIKTEWWKNLYKITNAAKRNL
jgi:hypothetical protein